MAFYSCSGLASLVLVLLFCSIYADDIFDFKNLQGPPDEFQPSPMNEIKLTTSSSATIPFTFDDGVFMTSFLVDSRKSFGFCAVSPVASYFEYKFVIPGFSTSVLSTPELMQVMNGRHFTSILSMGDANTFPSECYEFSSPVIGSWNVTVHSKKDFKSETGIYAGVFLLWNDSPYKMKVPESREVRVGDHVELISQVHDHDQGCIIKCVLPSAPFSSHAIVTHPSGEQRKIQLSNALTNSSDGIFNGRLHVQEEGIHHVTLVFEGLTPEGLPFRRTSDQMLHAIKLSLQEVVRQVTAVIQGDYLAINFEFESMNYGFVYAEVWGMTQQEHLPIAWINGLTNGTLLLHQAWIVKSGALGVFYLQNVRVRQRYSGTFTDYHELHIRLIGDYVPNPDFIDIPFTDEMYDGPRPSHWDPSMLKKRDQGGKKILVHGYCSKAEAWPRNDFTDYLYFSDPMANRPTDQFAQMIIQFAKANDVDSFSLIAHSQGGLAALHIAAYYWSGLDLASGGNVITTMGSPYQGTVLAGNLASLGKLLGVACGANADLYPDGAEIWLRDIPNRKRELVHYYRTSAEVPVCALTTDYLGLEQPNDGIVNVDAGELLGGNDEGVFKNWCHTAKMQAPFHCSNPEWNKKINDEAAV